MPKWSFSESELPLSCPEFQAKVAHSRKFLDCPFSFPNSRPTVHFFWNWRSFPQGAPGFLPVILAKPAQNLWSSEELLTPSSYLTSEWVGMECGRIREDPVPDVWVMRCGRNGGEAGVHHLLDAQTLSCIVDAFIFFFKIPCRCVLRLFVSQCWNSIALWN